jgi:oligoribonuclease (3'-5' exoribonuclease)
MAVMYRPIKEQYKDKYSIVDYEPNEDMQELMKFAPLDVALSASFFLQNLGIELLNATMTYLKKELKTMTHSANLVSENNSPKTGVGIAQSINALEEMLPDMMRSQSYDLLNVSPISPSKNKKEKLKTDKLNNKLKNRYELF